MDRGVTDLVLAALVAICSDVLVLVSEMGRQQLLYIAIKYEALNCSIFQSDFKKEIF